MCDSTSIASLTMRPGTPPTSPRKAGKSRASSRVLPASTGTLTKLPALMAATGSTASTVPSGIGPEPARPSGASLVIRVENSAAGDLPRR